MTGRDVIVTDHAILRWLERVERIDVDQLRQKLARAGEIARAHGAASVIVGSGKLVVRDGVVVTTLRRGHHRRDLLGQLEIEIAGDIVASRRARSSTRRG